jgi:CBS domain containing-hemolysin-like protein
MTLLLIGTLVVIILSGILTGTEAALFSININKARQLHSEGKISDSFLKIVEERDKYVNTLVFLLNTVNIAGSMIIGGLATVVLGASTATFIFTPVLTILIIIFAEMLPKNGCSRAPNTIIGIMNPVLRLSRFILSPFVYIASLITETVIRAFLGDVKEEPISEQEITYLTKEAAKDKNSDVRKNEAEIIQKVFNLFDLKAKDIMTPRVRISWIDSKSKLEDVIEFAKSCEHSRIIVADGNVDNFKGVTYKEDLLIHFAEDKEDKTISELGIDTVKVVSENISAEALLTIFKKEKKLIAIVTDQYGGISGVVTLEDVIEILVGEIVDETDTVEDLRVDAISRKKMKEDFIKN